MKLIGMKETPKRTEIYYYLELESKSEIEIYLDKFQDEFQTFFKQLIKGDEAPKRWDHVQVKGTPAALFYSAVVSMKIHEVSPYQAIDDMAKLKVQGLYEILERYGSVCVSLEYGTMRPPFHEDETVVSNDDVSDFDLKNKEGQH